MDPYLETPDLWPDVHHELISEIRNALNPHLRPNYVARVELRVYVSDEDDPGRAAMIPDARVETTKGKTSKPIKSSRNGSSALAIAEPIIAPILLDEEIEEARLEIKHLKTGSLATVIEVMSPTNKIHGAEGRKSFLKKRLETLESKVNWVEIDLLRAGLPSLIPAGGLVRDYCVAVAKVGDRDRARFWPFNLRDPLPVVGIPLRAPDADVPLDLGAVLRTAYDRAAYDLSVDYRRPPSPRLRKEDARWADKLLRARKAR
jgi:hypothetical protein